MQLGIGAGAVHHAGVEDLIARAEQLRLRPDRADHAGAIEAEHAGRGPGIDAAALLGIDRVDRNGTDFDQQFAPLRRGRRRQVKLDQRVLGLDRQRLGIGDGFHGIPQPPSRVAVRRFSSLIRAGAPPWRSSPVNSARRVASSLMVPVR